MARESSYRIFFHNDIDGIITAAIFIYSYVYGNRYILSPVKSSTRGEKFNKIIKEIAEKDSAKIIVLDYQHCQGVDIWVDHHWTKEFGDRKMSNSSTLYDPTAKSSARVLCNNMFGWNLIFNPDMIDMTDMIDMAEYPSIDFIFENTDPLMILRAYIEQVTPLNVTYSRVVESIVASKFDFDKVLYQLELDASMVSRLKEQALTIKKEMVISGDFSIVRQNRLNKYPRYAEYLVKPDLKYSIKFSNLGGDRVKFGIGYNKWCQNPNDINLGKIISDVDYLINGGGHYNVAAATLYEKDVERLIDYISTHLNKEEGVNGMEKYGVDAKEDAIEQKAVEMVKTGKAKNIYQARKKVVSEKGGKSTNVQRGEDEL